MAKGIGRILSSVLFGLLMDLWHQHQCLFSAIACALASLGPMILVFSGEKIALIVGYLFLGIGIGSLQMCK